MCIKTCERFIELFLHAAPRAIPRAGAWLGLLVCAHISTVTPASSRQRTVGPDSVVLVPGPHYEAGWFRRFLLGDHHRDLWTRPITVAVLDLSAHGGLTAVCRGGGFQTRSLRFVNPDGRQFVFRSVDKDPSVKLAPELRQTFVADILQDQISSHHPAGALAASPLLEAVGVLHAPPQMAIMPRDSRLGDFAADFADVLGLLEERPRDGPDGAPGFAGSRRIEGTDDVWDAIEESSRDRVDARAFLTARLMDVYLGDWDRHYDQWRWARYPAGDGYVWRPIPRDRDQVFASLDGVVLSLARHYVRELVSFGPEYPSIFGLTWTGRALDRRFLVGLDRAVWDSVALSVQARLTDDVLAAAVAAMPAAIGRADGEWLLHALQRRRADLPNAATSFYELLAEIVDIHATDERDYAEVVRLDSNLVAVALFAEGRDADTAPYYRRTFTGRETKEIRLYLHGGRDTAVVRGNVRRSILIRVIGGGGDDFLADSSRVAGAEIPTRLYDARGDNVFEGHQGTVTDRQRFRRSPRTVVQLERRPGACGDSIPAVPPRDLADPFRDWGADWFPTPAISYNPDLGLFVGYGARRFGYGFRKQPYDNYLEVFGAIASKPMRGRAQVVTSTRDVAGRFGLSLDVRYSGIDVLRFHGFGNETEITQPSEFYKLTQRQVTFAPSVDAFFGGVSRFALQAFFKLNHTRLGRGNLVDAERPYGSAPFKQIGGSAFVEVDTRDRPVAATRGIHLTGRGTVVTDMLDPATPYGSVEGSFAAYLSAAVPLEPTLALRVGGKKIWGEFPFFEAAFLGGAANLRGFNEQRFAGDALVHANAELRLFLTNFRLLLPVDLGVFGLADIGRVYLEGEDSDEWHMAAGGGVWFAFLDRNSTISVGLAQSVERLGLYISLGFMM
ncbi:MAG: BamA/TamA family outer membrane protein [Gemmatimonadetes bacterium]|nr:BamA/TamA family outer membrane protein [Gemmatimonadota bacterium]